MSYIYHLYRAPAEAPPLFEWAENLAEPVGRTEEVRAALAEMYPHIEWIASGRGGWMGIGRAHDDGHGGYLEALVVHVNAFANDQLHMVDVSAAPPVLRAVMRRFGLTACCGSEDGQLRNPFAVGDSWPDSA